MSTYDELMDHCVSPHNWMLFPAGWSVSSDWPNLAACHTPAPLLVQYALDDALPAGMRSRSTRRCLLQGRGRARGPLREFYPGPRRLMHRMQQNAFGWLKT
jgi:hypothetical protein